MARTKKRLVNELMKSWGLSSRKSRKALMLANTKKLRAEVRRLERKYK